MSEGLEFEPATLTVAPGTTVTFVNRSLVTHTVTALASGFPEGAEYFASGGFRSEKAARDDLGAGFIGSGETFEIRLDVPGTYRYVCLPHEGSDMSGKIRVE